MKLLIVTPYIPYPLTTGGNIAQFAVIDELRKHVNVVLVLNCESANDGIRINQLKQLWPDVSIKIIDSLIKESLPGAKTQIKYFILKYIKQWFKLFGLFDTGEIQSNKRVSDFDFAYLRSLCAHKSRSFIDQFKTIIEESDPDIIEIDFVDYIDLVYTLPKKSKKAFVHHEIRFARLQSTLDALEEKGAKSFEEYIIKDVLEKEKTYLSAFDGIIVFSESDKNKLTDHLPDKKISVSPFPVLANSFITIDEKSLEINKLVFVGGDDHLPNWNAIEWYFNTLASEVNKKTDLVLHVIGKWKQENIQMYSRNGYIQFAGVVDNLIEYCKNSIMIVPIWVGSGIRTKILYAMAQGVPVISTSLGCEGIGLTNNKEVLISDTPDEIIKSIVLIQKNKEYAYQLSVNAQSFIKQNFSQEHIVQQRLGFFTRLMNDSK